MVFPNYQDSETMIRDKDFAIESTSASVQHSIEILMERLKFVVTEKNRFQFEYKSKLIAHFGNFFYQEFDAIKSIDFSIEACFTL